MRLFVAVEANDEIREALARLIERLRPATGGTREGVRFVKPENAHLTMLFLGERDESLVAEIGGRLEDVRKREPFTVALGGLSAFPGLRQARVAWAGIRSGQAEIADLTGAVRERLAEFAEKPAAKSPFVPHLTICRFRTPRNLGELEVFRLMQETELGHVRVIKFALMRSSLGPGGPAYEVIRRFGLEGLSQ